MRPCAIRFDNEIHRFMKYNFEETNSDETQERLSVLAQMLQAPNTPLLQNLEKEALEQKVPVIRTRTQGLIRFFLDLCDPDSILEVGTATGFSAILMHTYAPAGCRITTIEKVPYRAQQARDNFARAGITDIRLLEGDAAQILPELSGAFDFIFMDAAKAQYIRYLPDVKRLLSPGGVLITDNILQEGEILASKFAVTRRNRTIHKRMRQYLQALSDDSDLMTILLEAGDGAAVTVKKRREKTSVYEEK